MKLLILGATGRVGREAVVCALKSGQEVTAFVRDPAKLAAAPGLRIAVGDITHPETVAVAISGQEAVVNALGVDPLKASTFVGDVARTIIDTMTKLQVMRYVAITGTAQMPKTWFGALTIAILRRTPVGHAIRDHDRAFAIVTQSKLEWTLAACPYIRDGRSLGRYTESAIFTGGFKTIVPGDVADFLIKSVTCRDLSHRVIGIWN